MNYDLDNEIRAQDIYLGNDPYSKHPELSDSARDVKPSPLEMHLKTEDWYEVSIDFDSNEIKYNVLKDSNK